MGYWYIDFDGTILGCVEPFDEETERKRREIGNSFETEEEAKKALEKLKAWKRLKDSGFKIKTWVYALEGNRENGSIPLEIKVESKVDTPYKDLDLLFGGEDV